MSYQLNVCFIEFFSRGKVVIVTPHGQTEWNTVAARVGKAFNIWTWNEGEARACMGQELSDTHHTRSILHGGSLLGSSICMVRSWHIPGPVNQT